MNYTVLLLLDDEFHLHFNLLLDHDLNRLISLFIQEIQLYYSTDSINISLIKIKKKIQDNIYQFCTFYIPTWGNKI